jgi:hypothetical protein
VSTVKSGELWTKSRTDKAGINSEVRGKWTKSRIDNAGINSEVRGKWTKSCIDNAGINSEASVMMEKEPY